MDKYGLYLNCKTFYKGNNLYYNYTSDDVNKVNFFCDDFGYITETKNSPIIRFKQKYNEINNDSEYFLFKINKNEEKNIFKFAFINFNYKPPYDINLINKHRELSALNWEKSLWYVINSEKSENKYCDKLINSSKNNEYFLDENDILKIGSYKYLISKIHIKNKTLNKKEKFINTEPYCKKISKCELCGKPTIQLCKCLELYHIDEIKSKMNENHNDYFNSKKTVHNYYFDILSCDETSCQVYYTLKYKCKESDLENIKLENLKMEKNQDDDIIINFFDFEIPENKDYMIIESIDEKTSGNNYAKKSVHIIELNGDDILIGSAKDNDIIISYDPLLSQKHTIIRYDKLTGKINVKNLGKSGTLAFFNPIRQGDNYSERSFHFTKEPFYFQMNRTLFEANIMAEEDFKKNKKNNFTINIKEN